MRIISLAKKCVKFFAPVVFAICCTVLLVVSAQNFGTYSFRAEYIAEKRTQSANIEVPYLAHSRLTTEASLGQIDPCLLSDEIKPSFSVIDVENWEQAEKYKEISKASPSRAISYGIKMWKYKDPTYPDQLCKEKMSK